MDRNGYAVISRGRRGEGMVFVHRAAWEVTYGPIPEGASVLHRCDTPLCCNPACLFLGTQDDNMKDMTQKGRHWNSRKTRCKNGHEFTLMTNGRRRCTVCRNLGERRRRAQTAGRPA